MDRKEILQGIDKLLKYCETCEIRQKMRAESKLNHALLNDYCIKRCKVGKELQISGKQLDSLCKKEKPPVKRRRKKYKKRRKKSIPQSGVEVIENRTVLAEHNG